MSQKIHIPINFCKEIMLEHVFRLTAEPLHFHWKKPKAGS